MDLARLSFSNKYLSETFKSDALKDQISTTQVQSFFRFLDNLIKSDKTDTEQEFNAKNIYEALSQINDVGFDKDKVFLELCRNYKFKASELKLLMDKNIPDEVEKKYGDPFYRSKEFLLQHIAGLQEAAPDIYGENQDEYTLEHLVDALILSSVRAGNDVYQLKERIFPDDFLSDELFNTFVETNYREGKYKANSLKISQPHENHCDPSLREFEEGPFATGLKKLVFNQFHTDEARRRFKLLHDLGPKLEEKLREDFNIDSLQVIIVPYGSTVKGYSTESSDLEYGLDIYTKNHEDQYELDEVMSDNTTQDRVFEMMNKLISQAAPDIEIEGIQSEITSVSDLSNCFHYDLSGEYLAHGTAIHNIFLPIAYGDSSDIQTLRRNIIDAISQNDDANYDWQRGVQNRFRENFMPTANALYVKPKQFVVFKRLGLISSDFIENGYSSFAQKLYNEIKIPGLEEMQQEFSQ
jgi:hypothetical protein